MTESEVILLDMNATSALSAILGNNSLMAKIQEKANAINYTLEEGIAHFAYSQAIAMLNVRKSLEIESKIQIL